MLFTRYPPSLLSIFCLVHHSAHEGDYPQNSDTEGDGRFDVGPEYKIDPDLTDRGNAKGKTFVFSMPLAQSKIFPGTDKTLEPDKKPMRMERKITVYVPAAYKDGPVQLKLISKALDNLTISKDSNRSLPAFIAVAVENGGSDSKNSERGLEYDTLADTDAQCIHVVIQDQAGFHLKPQDEGVPPNLRLLPLPPYSPKLNPVERIGDIIKEATANRVFQTVPEIESAIESEIKPPWTTPQSASAPWSATAGCALKHTLYPIENRPAFN